MCLYKKWLLNPKYLPNKKNGYNPPICKNPKFLLIEAECGKCFECRKKKAREWSIRITEELKVRFGYFITLTISPEEMKKLQKDFNIPEVYKNENAIAKAALRRCLERIRKDTGKSLRHWCVTELGENNDRIHLHGIVFGQKSAELIKKHWKYGHIFVGTYCSARTANYITKYMLKMDVKHKWFTGRVFTSSGMGRAYVQRARTFKKFKGYDTQNTYTASNGKEIAMPSYYKNKLYTDTEKEILWEREMDKKFMYIHGEKIHKNDERTKQNLTEYYRALGRRVFYDNENDWKLQTKENKRARGREAYRKIRKEIKKNKEGLLTTEENKLIQAKLAEINRKSYCKFKENAILLEHQRRKYKQLNLFTL